MAIDARRAAPAAGGEEAGFSTSLRSGPNDDVWDAGRSDRSGNESDVSRSGRNREWVDAGRSGRSDNVSTGRDFSPEVLNAEVYVSGGRKPTGLRVVEWAREAEQRGAGEILLTSMDADGTRAGFDDELTAAVSQAVQIPVIASGGAGNAQHFADVFGRGKADAALAASIFHFGITDSWSLKRELAAYGVAVRL